MSERTCGAAAVVAFKCDVATISDQYSQLIFVERAPGICKLDCILDLHDFCINMMKYFDVSNLLQWISQNQFVSLSKSCFPIEILPVNAQHYLSYLQGSYENKDHVFVISFICFELCYKLMSSLKPKNEIN